MRIEKVDLGAIVKTARMEKGLTQEKLAERVDVGLRHISGIENEGHNPSFEVLYHLIRELNIPADMIFYPEKSSIDPKTEELIRMIYKCDDRSIKIIYAATQAALEIQDDY